MKEREFVLLPLAEIAPSLVLPCGTRSPNWLPAARAMDSRSWPVQQASREE